MSQSKYRRWSVTEADFRIGFTHWALPLFISWGGWWGPIGDPDWEYTGVQFYITFLVFSFTIHWVWNVQPRSHRRGTTE